MDVSRNTFDPVPTWKHFISREQSVPSLNQEVGVGQIRRENGHHKNVPQYLTSKYGADQQSRVYARYHH